MSANYRNGAENVPLREINKHLPTLVLVYDLRNDDAPLVEKRINYGDAEDRKWLGRISYWALTNHCSVETMAIVDAEAQAVENK
jgi:hypothetical protein